MVTVAAVTMCLYHLIASQKILLPTIQHYITHISIALVVIFLATFERMKNRLFRGLSALAVVTSLLCGAYLFIFSEALQNRAYFNTAADLAVGAMFIPLVIIAAWVSFGPVIPCLAIGVMIYPFIGQYLPEPFYCEAQSIADTITSLSAALDGGIFSILLPVSANYVFLYILFGSLLSATGATGFFLEVGKAIGSKVRGGPGIAAVVSSAFVGSVTGSVAANIAITGSFTIPLMKKVGYPPHQAGAIEAAASTGGLIMPPVMGATAFVMAGLTGLSYLKIIKMALIPGILYFFCAFAYVFLRGEQLKLDWQAEDLDKRELLLSAPAFFGPLLVIVLLLVVGYSAAFVAFWAVVSTIILALVRKDKRPSLGKFIEGFKHGAIGGSGIAAMIGTTGLIYSTFTYSGIGIKLAAGIYHWSGGMLIPALLIIGCLGILFGMAGVGVAGYIILAIFGVSALDKMGVGLAQAHFFMMYVASFAFITPPVAPGAVIASKVAAASYMKTAVEATKVAFAGFLLPYMFVFAPVLLLMPQDPLISVLSLAAAVMGIVAFQVAFVGHYLEPCHFAERFLFILSAGWLITFLFMKNPAWFGVGATLFAVLSILQWRKRAATRAASGPVPI